MQNLYRILDRNGVTLAYQVARDEQEASYLAANFYGIRGVARAEFVRAA